MAVELGTLDVAIKVPGLPEAERGLRNLDSLGERAAAGVTLTQQALAQTGAGATAAATAARVVGQELAAVTQRSTAASTSLHQVDRALRDTADDAPALRAVVTQLAGVATELGAVTASSQQATATLGVIPTELQLVTAAIREAAGAMTVLAAKTDDAGDHAPPAAAKLRGLQAAIAGIGKAGNTAGLDAITSRIQLYSTGLASASTRRESLAQLARLEGVLKAQIAAGNLTLQERIRIEEQLRAIQTARGGTGLGAWFGNAKGVLAGTLGAFAVTAAVGAVGRLTSGLFDAGTAALETESKFQTTFAGAAASVQDFLDTFGPVAGLNRTVAQDFAATAAAIMQGMGGSKAASADFSRQVLQLAGDLTSFHNIPIEETFAAIRSGVTGESEPMKRFGIVLLDTETKLRALQDTGKRNAKELTQQELALARLTLMTQKAGVANGDLARTQDSVANRARRAAAEWENIKIGLAAGLLPVFSATVSASGALAAWFRDNGPLIAGVASAAAAAGTLTLAWKGFLALKAAGGVAAIVTALGGLSAAALNPVVLTIAAIAAAIGVLVWWQQRSTKAAEAWTKAARIETDNVTRARRLTDEYRKLATEIESGTLKGNRRNAAEARLQSIREQLLRISPEFRAALEGETQQLSEQAAKATEVADALERAHAAKVKDRQAELARLQAQEARAAREAAVPGLRPGRDDAALVAAQARLRTLRAEIADTKAELRALGVEVDTPPRVRGAVVTTPAPPTTPTVDPETAKKIREAELAAAREGARNALAITQAQAERVAAINERAYAQGVRALGDYYAERRILTEAATAAEVAALRRERAAVAADTPEDEPGRVKQRAELAQLDARIRVQQLEGQTAITALVDDERRARQQLAQQREQAETRLLELSGQQREVAQRAIDAEVDGYDKLLGKLGVVGQARFAAVRAYADALTTRADYDEAERQVQRVMGELDTLRANIQADVERGLISELEGQRRIADAERARLPILQQLAERMLAFAEALKDQELVEAVRRLAAEFKGLAIEITPEIRLQRAADELEASLEQQFATLGLSVVDILGNTLAAGFEGGIGAAGDVLLKSLGGLFVQMGLALMKYGAFMMGLLPALSNPFTSGPAALIAGAALIALGGLLSGIATGKSGGGGGAGSGMIGGDLADRSGTITIGGGRPGTAGSAAAVAPTIAPIGGTSRTSAAVPLPPIQVSAMILSPNDPTWQRDLSDSVEKGVRRGLSFGGLARR